MQRVDRALLRTAFVASVVVYWLEYDNVQFGTYRGADKSLGRPGRKQATATEDFGFHISYL